MKFILTRPYLLAHLTSGHSHSDFPWSSALAIPCAFPRCARLPSSARPAPALLGSSLLSLSPHISSVHLASFPDPLPAMSLQLPSSFAFITPWVRQASHIALLDYKRSLRNRTIVLQDFILRAPKIPDTPLMFSR